MKKFIFLSVIFPALLMSGCKPVGQLHASLQYHNIDLRLVKSVMTMTTGDGKTDIRRLMEQETFSGKAVRGRVIVEYPKGLETTAKEIAEKFDRLYPAAKDSLGIDWSFDLVLKLVRVKPGMTGFHYSVKLGRNRRLTFPVPVSRSGPDRRWTPAIAHEMTEASMIAPKSRSGLVLADLYGGPFCIPTGTRWFRDGTSDYAQYLYGTVASSGSIYSELNRVRERLLAWSNCTGEPNWYNAATGLIIELNNRYGEDTIARVMSELSKESVPNGSGLNRAIRRATGVDIKEFLANYETPWAGFALYESGGKVKVGKVYPATPAERRGIIEGDVISTFAGEQVTSANGFSHILARLHPWEMVSIEVMRGTETIPMRIKLIPMPVDLEMFLRLSGRSR